MNTQQAKKLSLPDILAKLGHEPTRSTKGGNELWYASPFCDEKQALFHTSFLGGQWIWNDFGDIGGNIIDFAMRHQNVNVKGALAFLDRFSGLVSQHSEPVFKSTQPSLMPADEVVPPKKKPANHKLILDKVAPLHSMVGYVRDRGIDPLVARKYLVDVFYRNADSNKAYFAVGIKNRAGGYEIRNPYFKSSLGGKDLTLIKGRVGEGVAVFEGFMDFLSYLTDLKLETLEKDVIILNSATFGKAALTLIKESGYSKVHLFFDNDNAGNTLTENFITQLEDISVQPENHRYHPHKDYNEMLKFRFNSLGR